MFKLLLGSFTLVSMSAFSFPDLSTFNLSINNEENCANFEGNWKGSCVDPEGKKTESSMVLRQQGCSFLSSEAMKFVFGGVHQQNSLFPTGSSGATHTELLSTSAWNADRKGFTLNLSVSGGQLGKKAEHVLLEGEMKLEGNKLLTQYTLSGKTGNCTYEKQNE